MNPQAALRPPFQFLRNQGGRAACLFQRIFEGRLTAQLQNAIAANTRNTAAEDGKGLRLDREYSTRSDDDMVNVDATQHKIIKGHIIQISQAPQHFADTAFPFLR